MLIHLRDILIYAHSSRRVILVDPAGCHITYEERRYAQKLGDGYTFNSVDRV